MAKPGGHAAIGIGMWDKPALLMWLANLLCYALALLMMFRAVVRGSASAGVPGHGRSWLPAI